MNEVLDHSINDTGIDPYGRFFKAQDNDGFCGLYAVQNLLKNDNIYPNDLDQSALAVSKMTGDPLSNHVDVDGYWSADTLSTFLNGAGYDVDYTNTIDFENDKLCGYIVHIERRFHYICLRRSTRHHGKIEICDSQRGIETLDVSEVKNRATKEQWNFFSVRCP